MNKYIIVLWDKSLRVVKTMDYEFWTDSEAIVKAKSITNTEREFPICHVRLYKWVPRTRARGMEPKVIWEDAV